MTSNIRTGRAAPNQMSPYEYRIGTRKEYLCRLCLKTFGSLHGFELHIRKHEPKCHQCKLTFKSWKQYKSHLPHCSRKFGIIKIEQRSQIIKKPKLNFQCQLCRRKYEKYEHLRNHQIQRCKKRYVSTNWIVKI